MTGEQVQWYRVTTVTVKTARFNTGTTVPSTVPFVKLAGGGMGWAPFRVTVTVNRGDTGTVVSPSYNSYGDYPGFADVSAIMSCDF